MGISGKVVPISAPDATVNGNQFHGAAYIVVKPSGGGQDETQAAKHTTTDANGHTGEQHLTTAQ